jgi:hypothetical protein
LPESAWAPSIWEVPTHSSKLLNQILRTFELNMAVSNYGIFSDTRIIGALVIVNAILVLLFVMFCIVYC